MGSEVQCGNGRFKEFSPRGGYPSVTFATFERVFQCNWVTASRTHVACRALIVGSASHIRTANDLRLPVTKFAALKFSGEPIVSRTRTIKIKIKGKVHGEGSRQ